MRRLRARGLDADVLNVITDELGGPWDAIYANAVFLHLSREQLLGVLHKTAAAVAPGGLLAFTLKEGDGEEWTTAKLGHPRHFTYWRAHSLSSMLAATPWTIVRLEQAASPRDAWLQCICSLG